MLLKDLKKAKSHNINNINKNHIHNIQKRLKIISKKRKFGGLKEPRFIGSKRVRETLKFSIKNSPKESNTTILPPSLMMRGRSFMKKNESIKLSLLSSKTNSNNPKLYPVPILKTS